MNYSQPEVKNSQRCVRGALQHATDEVVIVRINDFYFAEITNFQIDILG